jgi:hypothetical protein
MADAAASLYARSLFLFCAFVIVVSGCRRFRIFEKKPGLRFVQPNRSMDAIAFGWMNIWEDRVGSGGRWRRLAARTGAIAAAAALLLAGCASPGPPLPPSLKLPEVATDLTARRVGDQVMLHWTTPTRTTDKLLIRGTVTAEICRAAAAGGAEAQAATARKPERTAASECAAVLRETVTPGASDAVDPLPEALTQGPARLLEYRVQLKNAAGRTAGPSPVAVAAAGAAPGMVEELHATAAKQGVVLEWRRDAGSGETVELERTTVSVSGAPAAASQRRDALPDVGKEPAESHFRAGEAAGGMDAGGTVDRTAEIGATYRYTGQRVRSVAVGGQTLELRSAPSAAATVVVRDVFPPEAPAGLVAAPGFTGEADAQKPAIDLSWDPNPEPRVAGYRVYRRDADHPSEQRPLAGDPGEGGAWTRLDAELVREASYRDGTVVAGRSYAYRVTAVSDAGNESAPSAEVTETAPAAVSSGP